MEGRLGIQHGVVVEERSRWDHVLQGLGPALVVAVVIGFFVFAQVSEWHERRALAHSRAETLSLARTQMAAAGVGVGAWSDTEVLSYADDVCRHVNSQYRGVDVGLAVGVYAEREQIVRGVLSQTKLCEADRAASD